MKARPMKEVVKFQLEFMLMMNMCGRREKAEEMLLRLLKTIDMIEGDYAPQQLELDFN